MNVARAAMGTAQRRTARLAHSGRFPIPTAVARSLAPHAASAGSWLVLVGVGRSWPDWLTRRLIGARHVVVRRLDTLGPEEIHHAVSQLFSRELLPETTGAGLNVALLLPPGAEEDCSDTLVAACDRLAQEHGGSLVLSGPEPARDDRSWLRHVPTLRPPPLPSDDW